MRPWLGILPYFLVRFIAIKFGEKVIYEGLISHKAVGGDWICHKTLKGQSHDKRT